MLAISLTFPAKRFHATPWGRQVNEGAVEWPPSPWRLLRSLVAVWHHKFPDVPATDVRELIDRIAAAPQFRLPPATQGHTRHYMPLVSGEKTKVFDTFIVLEPDAPVVAVWPEVELSSSQRDLLSRLVSCINYFGRAESWVCGEVVDEVPIDELVRPLELGDEPPVNHELVRTLVPANPEDHAGWYAQMRDHHQQQRLQDLRSIAEAKGRPVESVKLSKKDEQTIAELLPETMFDALYADTNELRKAGWNQPPGTRWVNYARPVDALTSLPFHRIAHGTKSMRPTVARFAVASAVRPRLIDAIWIGERVRTALMHQSRAVLQKKSSLASEEVHAAEVFSGKTTNGRSTSAGHRHGHYLAECYGDDRRISHVTVFAPCGFNADAETALSQFRRTWGRNEHDLQFILLGIGQPEDFGGNNFKAGQSPLLDESDVWFSRTPFVPADRLRRRYRLDDAQERHRCTLDLQRIIRAEFKRRDWLQTHFDLLEEIEPVLDPGQCHANLGGHHTAWLEFRRDRKAGGGCRGDSQGFGIRLRFKAKVRGPIAIGYGCHFGLGTFIPQV